MTNRIRGELSPWQKELDKAAKEIDPYLYLAYSYIHPSRTALFRQHPDCQFDFHIMDLHSGISGESLQKMLRKMDNSSMDFDKESRTEIEQGQRAVAKKNYDRRREEWKDIGKYISRHY